MNSHVSQFSVKISTYLRVTIIPHVLLLRSPSMFLLEPPPIAPLSDKTQKGLHYYVSGKIKITKPIQVKASVRQPASSANEPP